MRYLAGIDGGQSSTVAVVVDETGSVLGRGTAGPCDDVGESPTSERLANNTSAALLAATAAAGIGGAAPAAVVIGISGFEGRLHGAPPSLGTTIVRFVHDAPIALAGALAGVPGIVAIAGTGSIAYGVDRFGEEARSGGWGYLFGDDGSAFGLARAALAAAAIACDRRLPSSLAVEALHYFGERDLRRLVRAIYTGAVSRPGLAGFGAVVAAAAASGDGEAIPLVEVGARALAEQVGSVASALHFESGIPVALVGGMFTNAFVTARVAAFVSEREPRASIEPVRYDPALGAALLAFDAAGVARPAAFREVESLKA